MAVKQKILDIAISILKATIKCLGERRAVSISTRIIEQLNPTITIRTNLGLIKF